MEEGFVGFYFFFGDGSIALDEMDEHGEWCDVY
jgi:hypothetical protein